MKITNANGKSVVITFSGDNLRARERMYAAAIIAGNFDYFLDLDSMNVMYDDVSDYLMIDGVSSRVRPKMDAEESIRYIKEKGFEIDETR